jgi:hypothetical protein
MSNIHPAVLVFRNELEQIESPDVRTFTQNVLSETSETFHSNDETVMHVKKTFKILAAFLEKDHTKGMLRDIMLASVLLQDICVNSLEDKLKYLHPLVAIDFVKQAGMQNDLPAPVMDGLFAMIESHEWDESPSKTLEPKPGTPNFLVALANRVARFDFITVEI